MINTCQIPKYSIACLLEPIYKQALVYKKSKSGNHQMLKKSIESSYLKSLIYQNQNIILLKLLVNLIFSIYLIAIDE